jgi:hypothetical protein
LAVALHWSAVEQTKRINALSTDTKETIMKTDSKTTTVSVRDHHRLQQGGRYEKRGSGRWRVLRAVAAGMVGLMLAMGSAHACPARNDPFYIKVVAKGEGATHDEGFLAAFDKLSARVRVLADGLQLTPGRRIIVGETGAANPRLSEESEGITVTLETWYFLDSSAMSMESFSNSCIGTGALGIINEYDMEKYDQ